MRAFWKLFALLLLLSMQYMHGQGVGTWKTYLSYHNTTAVAEANNVVYAVANGSLYSYGKEDQHLRFYSREEGLSDSDIAFIGYNPDVDKLLIVYDNENIDLLSESETYNLPYLLNSTNLQNKEVNSYAFYKEYAYLALQSGILVVDMRKNEIKDTYKLNRNIYATCVKGENLYAATEEGLLSVSMDDNLLDPNNWKPYTITTDLFEPSQIRKIALFQNSLCLFVKGKGVYYEDANRAIQPLCIDSYIQNMTVQNGKLLAYADATTYICYSLTSKIHASTGTIRDISSLKGTDTYWVAAGDNGLRGMKRKGTTNQMEVFVADLIAEEESPKRNLNAFMSFQHDQLLVAGGGRAGNRLNNPATFMTLNEEGKWQNFDESQISKEVNTSLQDVTSAVVDPNDPTHYYFSTWGEGVIELKAGKAVAIYNASNSPLGTATGGATSNDNWHYTRVEGLCYDSEGNLWMTNTAVNSCIYALKNDGKWANLNSTSYSPLFNQSVVDKILITGKGTKWVNILRAGGGSTVGIVAFDDRGTIDDPSDDIVNKFSSFNLNSPSGEAIPVNSYYCMAEDKNGQIWLGTDKGPIICPVPERAISDPDNIYCTRIVRSIQEDIPSYFMDNVPVTAIAVDGGNRKWLGTNGSGVFLVNEDGSETVEQFTTENSPLLSDNIQSIAINDQTGEVFFGTDRGIISYMSDASEGKADYSEVYAYPNPVRPEHPDKVTIVGLMADSNVKITDLSGNIIYQAKSAGGQLTWNCRGKGGSRVASGIYLVLASTPDAGESVVTKIMIVK